MKINVTPELRKAIKAAIEEDRSAKLRHLNSLSIISSPIDAITKARAEFEKADEQAKMASNLLPGTEADLNVTTGALTWGELPDHRPVNWRNGWAWSIPSRSGGQDHHVTVGRKGKNWNTNDHNDLESACDCPGGNFNGTCWAQDAIVKFLKTGDYSFRPEGVKRVWYSGDNDDFGKRRESYDD